MHHLKNLQHMPQHRFAQTCNPAWPGMTWDKSIVSLEQHVKESDCTWCFWGDIDEWDICGWPGCLQVA